MSSADEGPITNTSEEAELDTPDTDPDPEVLTRAPSGPVYSVFSPGMKRWIIAVVMLTSFISPMTAVSTELLDKTHVKFVGELSNLMIVALRTYTFRR